MRPRKPKVEVTPEVSTKATRKKVEGENTPTTSSVVPDSTSQGQKLSDLFAHSEDKVILLISFKGVDRQNESKSIHQKN